MLKFYLQTFWQHLAENGQNEIHLNHDILQTVDHREDSDLHNQHVTLTLEVKGQGHSANGLDILQTVVGK